MFAMKFSTPILPYSKFFLTQNNYTEEFLKIYDEDKNIDVIGVHFPKNENNLAKDAVGVHIRVTKNKSLTQIESTNTKRFRIVDYDPVTNICSA